LYETLPDLILRRLNVFGTKINSMLLTEWNTEDAKEVWYEEGREEGREEGIVLTARNALAKGISLNVVRDITGLDIEAIERIRNENYPHLKK